MQVGHSCCELMIAMLCPAEGSFSHPSSLSSDSDFPPSVIVPELSEFGGTGVCLGLSTLSSRKSALTAICWGRVLIKA